MATLFLLAHHDDEVFCAARLWGAVCAGHRPRLLWATAGGLAPARRRIAEGRRVCALLGIDDDRSLDLALRDQRAVDDIEAIAAAAADMLGEPATHSGAAGDRTAPDAPAEAAAQATVYVPAFEGGHPDHDAVNLAAALLRRRRPDVSVAEFPLYRRDGSRLAVQTPQPAANTPDEPCAVLEIDEGALAFRRRLVRANASQRFVSLEPLLALARWAGRGRAEPARPLPAHDYTAPPHPGRLLYEMYTRHGFGNWREAARDAIDEIAAPPDV